MLDDRRLVVLLTPLPLTRIRKHTPMRTWIVALLALVLTACSSSTTPPVAEPTSATSPAPKPAAAELRVHVAHSDKGMVSSVSDHASEIGAQVLRDGGNAVDAAIAVEFALAVTWPEAGNIGGGGFMLVAPPQSEVTCIDYREVAPLDATVDMYTLGENRHNHRHVGVPGTPAGMERAHERFGSMEWSKLVEPAVKLAREGFVIDGHLASSINRVLLSDEVQTTDHLAELRRVYGKPDGSLWEAGDTLVLPDLANTLQAIADRGADGFYRGPVAEQFAADMKAHGGLINEMDLAGYEARVRKAIHTTYRGYDVYGAPPPSSGGITITLMLNMLERYDLTQHGRFDTETVHLMAEAMKRAFSERAKHLGDTDFVDVPITELTSKVYARALAASITADKATPSEELAPPIELAHESTDTTHFSVVDSNGMAVANTTTLEQSWGSRVIPEGLGFVCNNEMGDFNWKPGYTDRKGRIGTAANIIEPGKRMLSSMSPTIVRQHGQAMLITGSPGGRTIINTVMGNLVSVLDYGMGLPETINSPRFHHQWFPDNIRMESGYDNTVAEQLRGMGHEVEVRSPNRIQGSAHSIYIDPSSGERVGVADYRRGGKAVGE